MAKVKKSTKVQKQNNQFAKPSAKWYKSMRIWFYAFLGLVGVRLLLFLTSQGQIQTNDLWLRFLVITFGTVLAWWYVKRREKGK